MLACLNSINGLRLFKRPEPIEGSYRFRVTERYYRARPTGEDVNASYLVTVPEDDVTIEKVGDGLFELEVSPTAFQKLEQRARERGVNDMVIYPVFA